MAGRPALLRARRGRVRRPGGVAGGDRPLGAPPGSRPRRRRRPAGAEPAPGAGVPRRAGRGAPPARRLDLRLRRRRARRRERARLPRRPRRRRPAALRASNRSSRCVPASTVKLLDRGDRAPTASAPTRVSRTEVRAARMPRQRRGRTATSGSSAAAIRCSRRPTSRRSAGLLGARPAPRPGWRTWPTASWPPGCARCAGRVLGDEQPLRHGALCADVEARLRRAGPVGPAQRADASTVGSRALRPTPVPAIAPAADAAAALAVLLAERGVRVGGFGEGAAPVGRRRRSRRSSHCRWVRS